MWGLCHRRRWQQSASSSAKCGEGNDGNADGIHFKLDKHWIENAQQF